MAVLAYESHDGVRMTVPLPSPVDRDALHEAVRRLSKYAKFGHRGVTARLFDQITDALVETGQYRDRRNSTAEYEYWVIGNAQDLFSLTTYYRTRPW